MPTGLSVVQRFSGWLTKNFMGKLTAAFLKSLKPAADGNCKPNGEPSDLPGAVYRPLNLFS